MNQNLNQNFKALLKKQQKRKQKIFDKKQPDTTDKADLESEESAEQRRKQKGQELKILTPNQTLITNQLPITLAQLKQGLIQNNLKMKYDNCYILCVVQKILPKQSIII